MVGVWRFCFLALASATILPVVFEAAEPPSKPVPKTLAVLDHAFELPAGFHIYRAAGPELSGGSYDLCVDGDGRLLVGDGNAIRRLKDVDGDGVFDAFEVIATDLGWRGPQGLLVDGDKLYAVGGDGIELFEGYRSGGPLVRRGRLGNALRTGGDHDAHTILRGHDGWLYFVAGDGGGQKDRSHITATNSPVLFAREGSVFRISPDGKEWECVSTGGRNAPSLGMNSLGDLFSFDSDMEWHVGLPWYRPVRLNHWALGGDQGWQDVGAYPPYYVDCLAGVLEVGRGSPTWGVFYEHNQFPADYHDAFLACDYRLKKESDDQYNTSGRLVAFVLRRDGAEWKAQMRVVATPKPDARDADGRPVSFALVDVEVAPDGSVFLSDHNQGIWRLFYNTNSAVPSRLRVPQPADLTGGPGALANRVLSLPQPSAEWTRIEEERIKATGGAALRRTLVDLSLSETEPLARRLRALRILSSDFRGLTDDYIRKLAVSPPPELRGQAAWLAGIRGRPDGLVTKLLRDEDAFVRRRAAEASTRLPSTNSISALLDALGDPSRVTRYVAMAALAHLPAETWVTKAVARTDPQARMRGLAATVIRREMPPSEITLATLSSLLLQVTPTDSREDRLDLMRTITLFERVLDPNLRRSVETWLLANFPDTDVDVRREQVRLLGAFRFESGFGPMVQVLQAETDPIAQFHVAQALSRLDSGWTDATRQQLMKWLLSTQTGWFAEFANKGVEFPHFWASVLAEFGARHDDAFLDRIDEVDFASLLGGTVVDLVLKRPEAADRLIALYKAQKKAAARVRIVNGLRRLNRPEVAEFLRAELKAGAHPDLHEPLLRALAAQTLTDADVPWLLDGVKQSDVDTIRPCAEALQRLKPALNESMAKELIRRLAAAGSGFHSIERTLMTLSDARRPDARVDVDLNRRPEDNERLKAVEFWRDWYVKTFAQELTIADESNAPERSDEELHRVFVASEPGYATRGAVIYERLQCHTCHGGGAAPGREGRIFGPDLAGVTRRLSRQELAEAIVYPSRRVEDRFRAIEIEKKDGTVLTGFVTEQTDPSVTLVDKEQVHRINRSEIQRLAPLTNSLMPDRLLSRSTDQEISDLLAYLDRLGAPESK